MLNTQHLRIVDARALARIITAELLVVGGAVALSVASERFLPFAVVAILAFRAIRLFACVQQPIDFKCELARLSRPPQVFILLLLLMLLVALWATAFPDITIPQVLRVITGAALYGAIVRWVVPPVLTNMAALSSAVAMQPGAAQIAASAWDRGGRRLWLLANTLLLIGLLLALITPFVVDWRGSTKLSFIPASLYSGFRLWVSDSVNPNVMAGTLVILVPIPLALLLFGGRGRLALLWPQQSFAIDVLFPAVSLIAMLVVLVLMQSRSALLAFGISMIVLALMRWRPAWIPVAFLAIVLIAFLAVRPEAGGTIFSLLTTSSVLSGTEQRIEIWSRALYMIQDFPFTGIGMGTFRQVTDLLYPLFLTPSGIPHAHNLMLQIAVDLGLPGLIAWFGIFITVIVFCWRSLQFTATRNSISISISFMHALAAGLLCSQVALFVGGLTDAVTWGMVRSAPLVWALWGVAMACWLLLQDQPTCLMRRGAQ